MTLSTGDFCQSEIFQPRCLPGETAIIRKAVYGRMSHDSRCLQDEEEVPALKNDPKHTGCFEDVMQLVNARCSGQSDCEIRVPDPEMEKTNPCYRYTVKYLEIDYRCVKSKSCLFRLTIFYTRVKVFSTVLLRILVSVLSWQIRTIFTLSAIM